MVKTIPNQSGMTFIADNAFHIEVSALYKEIGDGIRSVELIRVMNDKLLFIEAKTSFANPDNPNVANKDKFNDEVWVICEKFIHSLNLLSSVEVGVANYDYSDKLIIPEKSLLVFILIVKNHKLIWCKHIQEKIISVLPYYLKII